MANKIKLPEPSFITDKGLPLSDVQESFLDAWRDFLSTNLDDKKQVERLIAKSFKMPKALIQIIIQDEASEWLPLQNKMLGILESLQKQKQPNMNHWKELNSIVKKGVDVSFDLVSTDKASVDGSMQYLVERHSPRDGSITITIVYSFFNFLLWYTTADAGEDIYFMFDRKCDSCLRRYSSKTSKSKQFCSRRCRNKYDARFKRGEAQPHLSTAK